MYTVEQLEGRAWEVGGVVTRGDLNSEAQITVVAVALLACLNAEADVIPMTAERQRLHAALQETVNRALPLLTLPLLERVHQALTARMH
jgi:2-phospho-L-lactate transferase/gluconeogenesis factor (CofD/UPF0052 family)